MSEQIGFVVLDGTRIFIRVKSGKSSKWVSQRWTDTEAGARLDKVERRLKKIPGARQNLLNGRMVAI